MHTYDTSPPIPSLPRMALARWQLNELLTERDRLRMFMSYSVEDLDEYWTALDHHTAESPQWAEWDRTPKGAVTVGLIESLRFARAVARMVLDSSMGIAEARDLLLRAQGAIADQGADWGATGGGVAAAYLGALSCHLGCNGPRQHLLIPYTWWPEGATLGTVERMLRARLAGRVGVTLLPSGPCRTSPLLRVADSDGTAAVEVPMRSPDAARAAADELAAAADDLRAAADAWEAWAEAWAVEMVAGNSWAMAECVCGAEVPEDELQDGLCAECWARADAEVAATAAFAQKSEVA